MVTQAYEPDETDPVGVLVQGDEYKALTADQLREALSSFHMGLNVVRHPDESLKLYSDDDWYEYRDEDGDTKYRPSNGIVEGVMIPEDEVADFSL